MDMHREIGDPLLLQEISLEQHQRNLLETELAKEGKPNEISGIGLPVAMPAVFGKWAGGPFSSM